MLEISWFLVFIFAITGVGMGFLSCLKGLPPKVENSLWWILYAVWITVVLLTGSQSPFRTLLISSILAGLLHGTLSALLIDKYKQNNPWHVRKMKGSKSDQQVNFIKIGLLVGTVFGLIVAGIGLGLSRLL